MRLPDDAKTKMKSCTRLSKKERELCIHREALERREREIEREGKRKRERKREERKNRERTDRENRERTEREQRENGERTEREQRENRESTERERGRKNERGQTVSIQSIYSEAGSAARFSLASPDVLQILS
jgi:ATP-dependent RNA helicase DDX46/PRP5